jgi:hypothetical protein
MKTLALLLVASACCSSPPPSTVSCSVNALAGGQAMKLWSDTAHPTAWECLEIDDGHGDGVYLRIGATLDQPAVEATLPAIAARIGDAISLQQDAELAIDVEGFRCSSWDLASGSSFTWKALPPRWAVAVDARCAADGRRFVGDLSGVLF